MTRVVWWKKELYVESKRDEKGRSEKSKNHFFFRLSNLAFCKILNAHC